MIPKEWLHAAEKRLDGQTHRTPLTYDAGRGLYIKWENRQKTGSFKARGALNKALTLEDWEREMGLVTASAGNHGQGVALAGKLVGASVKVFASKDAPFVKVNAMRALGAEVALVEGGYHDAEEAGLAFAKRNDAIWLSPYNDGHVVAGQGTVASEILQEHPETAEATWLVPVSGGGLLAGISAVLRNYSAEHKQANPARVIGVQVAASAFMHSLFYHGNQDNVEDLPTLADGLTGAVEAGSITIPLIKKYVDEIILVSEEEVAQAVAFAWSEYGEKIEGSGAVGLAAILSGKVTLQPTVIIVSGGNIQPEIHTEILSRYEK
ncbi:MAG: threonine/serine dehydratase [Anaerolineales bacterium]|uniref:threonine ammonia-lyase n=1 Tax=Candidatus Desulfolinea nitratireducens TaxID=2841698 RepID=A0A8J6NIE1_9CHLR|nr:threonine/serine dehydratase [Candidatus Desulfolinea nitratireducens]MBL6961173.1 threonine/serine dehydratase [Anaerolineales bacterium]